MMCSPHLTSVLRQPYILQRNLTNANWNFTSSCGSINRNAIAARHTLSVGFAGSSQLCAQKWTALLKVSLLLFPTLLIKVCVCIYDLYNFSVLAVCHRR